MHWVRTLYCYPSRVTDDLLDTLAGNEKICAYLDLPLQHIDGRLLKLMHRFGTPDDIRSVIRRTRERGITLRTTMIVGFPTETEDDFKRMLDFVEEARVRPARRVHLFRRGRHARGLHARSGAPKKWRRSASTA